MAKAATIDLERHYVLDLEGLLFEEESNATWLQALPLGTYDHPQFGEIAITPEKVANMVTV